MRSFGLVIRIVVVDCARQRVAQVVVQLVFKVVVRVVAKNVIKVVAKRIWIEDTRRGGAGRPLEFAMLVASWFEV